MVDAFLDHIVEVVSRKRQVELAGLGAGEVEQVADDREHALSRRANIFHVSDVTLVAERSEAFLDHHVGGNPMIEFSGVRTSWLIRARISARALAARSAWRLADAASRSGFRRFGFLGVLGSERRKIAADGEEALAGRRRSADRQRQRERVAAACTPLHFTALPARARP